MIKNEEEIFNDLVKKNPKFGERYSANEFKISNGKNKIYYRIFSWMINKESDIIVLFNRLQTVLEKYNISVQIYYDLIVLGLSSYSDRPNDSYHFISIEKGYRRIKNKNSSKSIHLKNKRKVVHKKPKNGNKNWSNKNQPINRFPKKKDINYTEIELINLYNKYSSFRKELDTDKDLTIYIGEKCDTARSLKYLLPKWISGEEDEYLGTKKLFYKLNDLGLTTQIYYDLVYLKLSSPLDRPLCKNCGKAVKFKTILSGYTKVCSLSCASVLGNKNNNSPTAGKRKGKRGDYKPLKSDKVIRYLSTWELKFMKMCDLSKDILEIDTVESIPYVYSGKDHMYIPDFKLKLDTGFTVIIEIKPKNLINDPVVIAKRITAKKYCRKMGYKYITLTEIELFKRIKGSFNIYDYVV